MSLIKKISLFFLMLFFALQMSAQLYLSPIKTDAFRISFYKANCGASGKITVYKNGIVFTNYTVGFDGFGLYFLNIPQGILAPGDQIYGVSNCGDGTSNTVTVQDVFTYVEMPNGTNYTGNGIAPTDATSPYTRLNTPVQLPICTSAVPVSSHHFFNYKLSTANITNTGTTSGIFKINGVPLNASNVTINTQGNSGTSTINANGSITVTSNMHAQYESNLPITSYPFTIEYTHNGNTDDVDLQVAIGDFGFTKIGNAFNDSSNPSSYAWFQYNYLTQNANSSIATPTSTYKLVFDGVNIKYYVDNVLINTVTRNVQYTTTCGTLSNTTVLPYGTPVNLTPTSTGACTVTATIDNFYKATQKINLVACLPPLDCAPGIKLNAKAILGGADFPTFDGVMRDDLRAGNYIPTSEPYTGLGYTNGVGGGGEFVNPSVFAVTGSNAIVDWVFLELRTDLNTLIASRSALIQVDGDIVDTDGVSPVTFDAPKGNYLVALRHRNHMGITTNLPVDFTSGAATVDFTSPSLDIYNDTAVFDGTERRNDGGRMSLWGGDANVDNQIIYQNNPSNDPDAILAYVLAYPTNTGAQAGYDFAYGYATTDVTMDGKTKYSGPDNDSGFILNNVIKAHPLNSVNQDYNFVLPGSFYKAATVVNLVALCKCYKNPTTTGSVLPTTHGITALGRAGANNGNWPMIRNGAWTALEAKTKGFVINRIATTALVEAIANPVEGMMVFDIQADCLKINTDGTTTGWKCFNVQACP